MKCDFHGLYNISRPASGSVASLNRAKCSRCGAVRRLQMRGGDLWYYPHHLMLAGEVRNSEDLVFSESEFVPVKRLSLRV